MENAMFGVKEDRSNVRARTGIDCSVDPRTGEVLVSATKQSFKDECDVNTIMRRYETTGTIDHVNRRVPEFGDFSQVESFHDAMNFVLAAEKDFMALPARVRERFGNDPGKLMEFIADPANREEALALGLINAPPPADEPIEVRVVDPSPPQPLKDAPASSA